MSIAQLTIITTHAFQVMLLWQRLASAQNEKKTARFGLKNRSRLLFYFLPKCLPKIPLGFDSPR